MSNHVSFGGRDLGAFKVDDLGKVCFVAENLETLSILLGLKPNDRVDVEGPGVIGYSELRKEYLDDVDAIYPSREAWIARGTRGRTKEIISRSG